MKDWVKIADFSDRLSAEIVKNRLQEAAIPSAILNKQDSMHLHLNTFLPVEVYVPKDLAFKAVQILNTSVDEDK
jgi:hypothetical protein